MKKRKLIGILITIVVITSFVGGISILVLTENNLFVHKENANIEFTFDDFKMYSAYYTNNPLENEKKVENSDSIEKEPGFDFYYKNVTSSGKFISGGTSYINRKKIMFNSLAPGDSIDFNIALKNESNCAIKYKIQFDNAEEIINDNLLKININNQPYLESSASKWELWSEDEDKNKEYNIRMYVPITLTTSEARNYSISIIVLYDTI